MALITAIRLAARIKSAPYFDLLEKSIPKLRNINNVPTKVMINNLVARFIRPLTIVTGNIIIKRNWKPKSLPKYTVNQITILMVKTKYANTVARKTLNERERSKPQ
jgi:hypothetical protein